MKAERVFGEQANDAASRQTTVLYASLESSEKATAGSMPERRQCIDAVAQAVELSGGRILRRDGNAVMAVFATPDAAVAGAARMNTYVETRKSSGGVGVRVGLEVGAVVQEGRDILGDTVNLAQQFCRLAGIGQIITSAGTAAKFLSAARSAVQPLQSTKAATREARPLREIAWRSVANRIIAEDKECSRAQTPAIRLAYRDKAIVRRREWDMVTFGRDPGQDFVIAEMTVSKRHCEIARQQGAFVLRDFSTNGTFLTKEGEGEVYVHHDEVVLNGAGWISLGQSSDDTDEVVRYRCEYTLVAA